MDDDDDDRASRGRWGWSAILHGHEPESREFRAGLVRIGQVSLLQLGSRSASEIRKGARAPSLGWSGFEFGFVLVC